MTRLTILSAAAVLAMMAATPVFAQFAQQEPAAFASMYPNANARSATASVPFGKSNAYAAHAQLGRHVTRPARPRHGY